MHYREGRVYCQTIFAANPPIRQVALRFVNATFQCLPLDGHDREKNDAPVFRARDIACLPSSHIATLLSR